MNIPLFERTLFSVQIEQIRQKMENQEQEVLYSDISGKKHFSEGCGVVMSNNKKKHQEPEPRGEKNKNQEPESLAEKSCRHPSPVKLNSPVCRR